jgi:DNA-binding CsgD family transcriptional regulator
MDLSPRQVQILSHIAKGHQDKEIAERLGMSTRTIDSHLQRLYIRHRLHSRAAIIAKWLLEGGLPTWAANGSNPVTNLDTQHPGAGSFKNMSR